MAELDSTAERVALWRALHVLADDPPHVLDDTLALRLVDPPSGWRDRPDMGPWTRPFRAGMVARARFVEELVAAEARRGVRQYVVLGAGVDTYALRGAPVAVFEIDRPATSAWKRARLAALGIDVPAHVHLVPFDFEGARTWRDALADTGFDATAPAVVSSTGVSMYLTREATAATLRDTAALAPGSTLAMTFLLRTELVDAADRPAYEASQEGARRSGTPFVSLYAPEELLDMARDAGFREVEHVPSGTLAARWFAGRADGLRPSTGEDFLVART